MSTESSTPATNGTHTSFLQRVGEIPLVSDGLTNAQSLIQSNSYSSAIYNKAGEYATSVYKTTEPYQKKFEPQIKQVDDVLNKGLDYVQSKIPYPFEATTNDVLAKARAPADHAYAVASSYYSKANDTIAPITERIQTQVNKTLETLRPLQEKLQANLTAAKEQGAHTASETQAKVQSTSHSIIGEVEGLINYLKTQTHELPAHVQSSLQPLLDKLGHGYTDIMTELAKKDVPLTTKAQNVLTYSKDNAIPLVHEALASLKELISKKSIEAKETTESAVDSAKETVEDAKNK